MGHWIVWVGFPIHHMRVWLYACIHLRLSLTRDCGLCMCVCDCMRVWTHLRLSLTRDCNCTKACGVWVCDCMRALTWGWVWIEIATVLKLVGLRMWLYACTHLRLSLTIDCSCTKACGMCVCGCMRALTWGWVWLEIAAVLKLVGCSWWRCDDILTSLLNGTDKRPTEFHWSDSLICLKTEQKPLLWKSDTFFPAIFFCLFKKIFTLQFY